MAEVKKGHRKSNKWNGAIQKKGTRGSANSSRETRGLSTLPGVAHSSSFQLSPTSNLNIFLSCASFERRSPTVNEKKALKTPLELRPEIALVFCQSTVICSGHIVVRICTPEVQPREIARRAASSKLGLLRDARTLCSAKALDSNTSLPQAASYATPFSHSGISSELDRSRQM